MPVITEFNQDIHDAAYVGGLDILLLFDTDTSSE